MQTHLKRCRFSLSIKSTVDGHTYPYTKYFTGVCVVVEGSNICHATGLKFVFASFISSILVREVVIKALYDVDSHEEISCFVVRGAGHNEWLCFWHHLFDERDSFYNI